MIVDLTVKKQNEIVSREIESGVRRKLDWRIAGTTFSAAASHFTNTKF